MDVFMGLKEVRGGWKDAKGMKKRFKETNTSLADDKQTESE